MAHKIDLYAWKHMLKLTAHIFDVAWSYYDLVSNASVSWKGQRQAIVDGS